MAPIKLFRKDKVLIEKVPATFLEGKAIILDTVWQAVWCDANVTTSVHTVISEVLPLFPKSLA